MNIGMMKKLIEQLAKEQFYEIIFVLLTVHRNKAFMDTVFKTMRKNRRNSLAFLIC